MYPRGVFTPTLCKKGVGGPGQSCVHVVVAGWNDVPLCKLQLLLLFCGIRSIYTIIVCSEAFRRRIVHKKTRRTVIYYAPLLLWLSGDIASTTQLYYELKCVLPERKNCEVIAVIHTLDHTMRHHRSFATALRIRFQLDHIFHQLLSGWHQLSACLLCRLSGPNGHMLIPGSGSASLKHLSGMIALADTYET